MIAVLDANAAVRLALGQDNHEIASKTLKEAEWVVAPSIYIYEISNAMWKYHQAELISKTTLKEKVLNCAELIDEMIPANELYIECYEMACRWGHPAYDMAYLAVCLRKEAGLISFDKKILQVAEKLNIECY